MLKTLVLQNSKKTTFFYNTKKCILKRKEINVFCPLITRKINYTNVRSNTKDEFEFFWITNLIKYLSIMLMGAISANYRIMRYTNKVRVELLFTGFHHVVMRVENSRKALLFMAILCCRRSIIHLMHHGIVSIVFIVLTSVYRFCLNLTLRTLIDCNCLLLGTNCSSSCIFKF